jgi:hypothetical protein
LCNHHYVEDAYLRILTCIYCNREMATLHWSLS